jgi:endonuclease YncB( thermonuclease family)
MKLYMWILLAISATMLAGCNIETEDPDSGGNQSDELYTVVRVIDGDTIDVQRGEVTYRVRYVGVNTPENDEVCYEDAAEANRLLVDGQQVRLERDESNTDRYGRLLRYVYAGNTFVNEALVRDGYAEAVLYEPDDQFYDHFLDLEIEAANAGRGCHPTGIFDDGSDTR